MRPSNRTVFEIGSARQRRPAAAVNGFPHYPTQGRAGALPCRGPQLLPEPARVAASFRPGRAACRSQATTAASTSKGPRPRRQ